MSIEEYLKKKYQPRTVQNYQEYINRYLSEQPKHQEATYQEITDYIGKERKRGLSPQTLNNLLQAIKKYYNYLQTTKQRKDHPCKYLYLKDKISRSLQLQDLFTSKELELLQEKTKEISHSELHYRNQLIVSLLIRQGLKSGELLRLELQDFNEPEGTVYIKPSAQSNSRKLRLEASQIYLLQKYRGEREALLKKLKKNRKNHPDIKRIESGRLLLTLFGTVEQGRGIPELTEALKGLFPERNLNPVTIRQSVIANKLKAGEDLRIVQVFAGHKKTSTTERYRQTDLEELRNEIEKYHPLQ